MIKSINTLECHVIIIIKLESYYGIEISTVRDFLLRLLFLVLLPKIHSRTLYKLQYRIKKKLPFRKNYKRKICKKKLCMFSPFSNS